MATRVKILRMLQEARGLAEITNRRPPSHTSGPLLLQFRPPVSKAVSKRKRTIRINTQDQPDIPHPVRITHVKRSAPPAARVAG